MDDSPTLPQRIEARRHQLAIYREAYYETYDRRLDPADHEARDRVLAGLEGRTPRGSAP